MKPIFEMLAGYNAWANGRLYEAAARLSDEDYRADYGAFFGSVHGTLNHLLVGDRIWMHRFTGEGAVPATLDETLYDDFTVLRRARQAEDARIIAFIATLAPSDFDRTIRYRTMSNPADIEQQLGQALLHLFNHQTHHRGQAHCLLTRITDEAPSFDLILFQRQMGVGLQKGSPAVNVGPQRRSGVTR
jgi:uncharacterized damage-inducible protein DinB